MTQQHLVGELSELIALLEPAPGAGLAAAVRALRGRVECSPAAALAPLAAEAVTMADLTCWATLDQGDTAGFARHSAATALLHEFAVAAHLLPEV